MWEYPFYSFISIDEWDKHVHPTIFNEHISQAQLQANFSRTRIDNRNDSQSALGLAIYRKCRDREREKERESPKNAI